MRKLSSFLAVVTLVFSAATASAKSPVQVVPDAIASDVLLVNKQVGNEQWVIQLNADEATLTGNVFDLSGKPPTFFACDVDFSPDEWVELADLASETLTLTCQVANGCTALPCEVEWQPLGTTPSIGGSFFLP